MLDALNWFLIYTKSRQEEKAVVNLQRQGYAAYHPKILIQKIQSGKQKVVEEALFPSYVFIQMTQLGNNWLPIRSTYGVRKIVRFGMFPAEVSAELIEGIRLKVDERQVVLRDKNFTAGQKVLILQGPMQGLQAMFQCYAGKDRVAVLLSILGGQSTVNLPIMNITSVF